MESKLSSFLPQFVVKRKIFLVNDGLKSVITDYLYQYVEALNSVAD